MQTGGIILCGGQSSRMGLPKATLPFGPELMLQRVHRLLREEVGPIVIVSAVEQTLPPLPPETLFARDEHPARGPLEGLRAGLKVMATHCELVYVTSCDVPLLQPAFVRQLLSLAAGYDTVVPREDEFFHPLSAVYRTSVLSVVEELLAADVRRPAQLLQRVTTRSVPLEQLRASDPELQTLRNLNCPADYAAALASAGFELPAETAVALGLRDR